ncbi:MAG: hypothetical protein JWN86_1729 [Planctomycetota bacterium]|nr:hypothetical protein [Planctomycetota bacterium]
MGSPSWKSPILWTTLHAILWFLPLALLPPIAPRFDEMSFADYGVELSASARWVIQIGHMLANLMPIVAAALLIVLAFDFAAIRHFRSRPDRRPAGRLWIAFMAVLPMMFVGFAVIAIGLPWMAFRHRLAG